MLKKLVRPAKNDRRPSRIPMTWSSEKICMNPGIHANKYENILWPNPFDALDHLTYLPMPLPVIALTSLPKQLLRKRLQTKRMPRTNSPPIPNQLARGTPP